MGSKVAECQVHIESKTQTDSPSSVWATFVKKNTVIWKLSWAEEFHKITVESSDLQATVVIKNIVTGRLAELALILEI